MLSTDVVILWLQERYVFIIMLSRTYRKGRSDITE